MSTKAIANNVTIAETDSPEVVESNHYFPRESVTPDVLRKSPTQYTCPWKGECTYYDVTAGDKVFKDGAWSYESPKEAAAAIAGHVAFDRTQITIDQEG